MKNLPLDFILSFCKEKIANHGEDSYCYIFGENSGTVAVFDGCGGAGAQTHECYGGHTEAYMASRFASGVLFEGITNFLPDDREIDKTVHEVLFPLIQQAMKQNEPVSSDKGFQIKGSMIRTLPTTVAVAVVCAESEKSARVSSVWAGDSRVYIMNSEGLFQLTSDDTTVPDPFENLYEDGILKNIICSDRNVKANHAEVSVEYPFLAFSATDGCFGYVSTPMEFEGIFLKTLLNSENVAQWESNIAKEIGAVSGDDHTLCMASFGFQDFLHLKASFVERSSFVEAEYLSKLVNLPTTNKEERYIMWGKYKENYLKYLKRT